MVKYRRVLDGKAVLCSILNGMLTCMTATKVQMRLKRFLQLILAVHLPLLFHGIPEAAVHFLGLC